MAAGDRLKAERRYIEDGIDPPELAIEFSVTERTVYRWASAGDWELRRAQRCHKLSEIVTKSQADAAAAWVADTAREMATIRDELLERYRTGTQTKIGWFMGEACTKEVPFANDAKDTRSILSCLKDIDDMARRAFGIGEPGQGGLNVSPTVAAAGERPYREWTDRELDAGISEALRASDGGQP